MQAQPDSANLNEFTVATGEVVSLSPELLDHSRSASIRVSVIVTLRDDEPLNRACLNSLTQQSLFWWDYEIHVVCLSDAAAEMAQATRHSHPQVSVHLAEAPDAFWQQVLAQARGDYVLLASHYDVLSLDALEALLFRADQTGADCVWGSGAVQTQDDKLIHCFTLQDESSSDAAHQTLRRQGLRPLAGALIRLGVLETHVRSIRTGTPEAERQISHRLLADTSLSLSLSSRLVYTRHEMALGLPDEAAARQILDANLEDAEASGHGDETTDALRKSQEPLLTVLRHLHAERSLPSSLPAEFRPQPRKVGETMEGHVTGDVILVCDADYHVRNSSHIARALADRGVAAAVVDLSPHWRGGARALSEDELSDYQSIIHLDGANYPENINWNAVKVAVFMNDHNHRHHPVVQKLNVAGIPTVSSIEGICDYLRHDVEFRPYRQTQYIAVPGTFDAQFFADRANQVSIVGLPQLSTLLDEEPTFPEPPRAVINVNFSYGVLTDHRQIFIESAVAACDKVGLPYWISKHPVESGDFSQLPVTQLSMYDAIRASSLFISRFATGILESLALGKPAVYHNPHGEQILKFQQPLGAYSLSDDVDNLAKAIDTELTFIQNKGNVRQRAADFLHHHANTAASVPPAQQMADLITTLIDRTSSDYIKRVRSIIRDYDRDRVVGPVRLPLPVHAQLQAVQREKAAILSSTSWRITAPLRALIAGLKKLVRSVRAS